MSETVNRKINKENLTGIQEKIICIKDEKSRKRAFISLVGVFEFSEYLKETGIKLSSGISLCSCCHILKEFDIADIRTSNDISIDVRVVLGNEYPQMCIPREHFEKGIHADIYVGVKIDEKLETAQFIGYINSNEISRTKGNKNYYIIDSQELKPISDIKETVNAINKNGKKHLQVDHEKAERLFVPLLDGLAPQGEENFLIEHIAECCECRKNLIKLSVLDHSLKAAKDKLYIEKSSSLGLPEEEPVLIDQSKEDLTVKEPEQSEPEEIFEENKQPAEEKPKQEKRHFRDWADTLANDPVEEKLPEKKPSPSNEKEILEEDKKLDESELDINLNENLPELNLSKDNSEFILDESSILSNKEKPEEDPLKPAKEPSKTVEIESIKHHVDELVENILGHLDDVEEINKEEDLDSLFSFIEPDNEKPSDMVEKQEVVENQQEEALPQKKEETEKPLETPSQDYPKEKIGDYATVLNSSAAQEQEDLDIIIYEETKETKVEEITQEDLLSIFDPAAAEEAKNKEGSKNLLFLKNLTKDKKLTIITAAVALSATALLVYMGLSGDGNGSSIIKPRSINNIENKLLSNEENSTPVEKREREPMTAYTREILKTVKNEKSVEKTVQEDIEKMFKNETNPEDKIIKKVIDIKNISWELGASVARNPKIKKYFLDVGYALKENLSKNLYEPDIKVKGVTISIYAEMNSRGNIIKSLVYEGSGSEVIDKKCINSMLTAMKNNNFPTDVVSKKVIKFKLLVRT